MERFITRKPRASAGGNEAAGTTKRELQGVADKTLQ